LLETTFIRHTKNNVKLEFVLQKNSTRIRNWGFHNVPQVILINIMTGLTFSFILIHINTPLKVNFWDATNFKIVSITAWRLLRLVKTSL